MCNSPWRVAIEPQCTRDACAVASQALAPIIAPMIRTLSAAILCGYGGHPIPLIAPSLTKCDDCGYLAWLEISLKWERRAAARGSIAVLVANHVAPSSKHDNSSYLFRPSAVLISSSYHLAMTISRATLLTG